MSHRCDAKVCRQLVEGVPTAGEDCGTRTVQRTIRWSSCGKVFATIKEIRHWMGKPTGPTNPPDWLRALRHPELARRFAKAGLHAPVAHLRGVTKQGFIVGSPVKTAIAALEDGKLICVAESYATWHGTKYSGSATFTGNHAVSYFDFDGDAGDGLTTTRYDSLADARAPGIAKGPDKVPWSLIEESMGLLDLDTSDARRPLGIGEWAGMVVARALPLKESPEPPTCAEQLADALARIEALEDADDDDSEATSDMPVVEGVTAAAAAPGEVEDVDE